MKNLLGTAIITGASSGIGAEFAKQLAAQGYAIILIGREKKALSILFQEIKKNHNVSIQTVIADLNIYDDVTKILNIIQETKNLKILINCAGFGIKKDFTQISAKNRVKMVNVHDNATIYLTHEAIKKMKIMKGGTIINVSSLAGLIVIGNNPVYTATKAFLHSFSQNLYRLYKKDNIYIQSLCPGFTATNFHKRAGRKKQPIKTMSAKKVVETSLIYAKKKKPVCIPGIVNKLFLILYKIIPNKVIYTLTKLFIT